MKKFKTIVLIALMLSINTMVSFAQEDQRMYQDNPSARPQENINQQESDDKDHCTTWI